MSRQLLGMQIVAKVVDFWFISVFMLTFMIETIFDHVAHRNGLTQTTKYEA